MNANISETFDALCGFMNVKRIVLVDDRNAEVDDKFIDFFGFCIELKTTGTNPSEQAVELNSVDFDKDDNDLREELRTLWDSWDQTTQDRLFDQMYALARPEEETNDTALTVIRELCQNVEYIALSLAGWQVQKENLLTQSSEIGTLFLFDEDLSKEEGGREDSGIDLLSETLAHTEAFCGLISYKFTPEQERDRWEALGTDTRVDKFRCVPISKKHLHDDPMSFARRIKFTALVGLCAKLQHAAVDAITNSFQAALERVREISIYDFEHIVFQASRAEGIWEPDTLFRLFGVFQRFEARQIVKSDDALDALVTNIRRISQIQHTAPEMPSPRHESWKIQRQELYEDAEHLNRYHLPIELGDVFEKTSGGSQFILLAQPCDLMLRENRKGERRPNATEVMLVRILNTKPDHTSDGFEELAYFNRMTGESGYADFRKMEVVKLCVLDLCVFQDDGSAKIRLSDPAPERLIPVWRMHYNNLIKDYETAIERYKTLLAALPGDTTPQIRSIAESMAVPVSSNQNVFKGKINIQENRISYDVRRIGRLNQVRAAALFTRFSHYSSRAAFDVDFGKED